MKAKKIGASLFEAELNIETYRNTLFAENKNGGETAKIVVFKLKNAVHGCRISLDDNILCLYDINKNKDVYTSIFDNAYLSLYKKAHDLYDAKIHMNIYYESKEEDIADFSDKRSYFNLSMMTDKFKDEWKQNSDWLKLSFHALSNSPDSPYKDTSFERLDNDIKKVHNEIMRFAGKECMTSVTTLHYGATNDAGVRALRQNGYLGLNGYFEFNDDGSTSVSYNCPKELVSYLKNRDFWRDNEEDIVYSKTDMVLNSHRGWEIIPELEKIHKNKKISGFIELLIHEQFFFSDYIYPIPEFEDIILDSAKWLKEHGYTFAHYEDIMFEPSR